MYGELQFGISVWHNLGMRNESKKTDTPGAKEDASSQPAGAEKHDGNKKPPREIGGRAGPDPTRYGDWEKNGRCIDF